MSDRTSAVVESDGIRVEKSFTRDDFPVPAVAFELTSDRDRPVTVRLVDTVPEAVPIEAIGFHPAYESEHWTAYSDRRVEFERTLEPAETVETVYGVRVDDPDPATFLTDPTVDHAPHEAEIADVLGPDGATHVREALATGPEGLEPLADTDPSEEASTAAPDADDPSEPPATSEPPSTAAKRPRSRTDHTTPAVTRRESKAVGSADDTDTAASAPTEAAPSDRADTPEGSTVSADPTGTVAAELAAAIRRDEVDEADLETLRSAFDTGTPPSVGVRLDRLQARVGEFDAYTDALSTLLDEERADEAVFDRLDALESAVESVETRVDAAERAHGALASDVTALSERLADVTDRLDTEVASLEDRTDEELARLEKDVQAVEAELAALETFRRRLNDAFDP